MTTRRRVARKRHRCVFCLGPIAKGHAYLVHTAFPGSDVVDTDVPVQSKECGDCANRYGRGHLCEPWPEGQEDRYWLGDAVPSYLDSIV